MTNELATAQDAPTHRLTIKLEDGSYRLFHLNEKQAEWLAQNINSPDRFIVLPKTVDKDAPQFYPKTWATLERMSEEEVEQRRNRYIKAVQTEQEKEAEAKKREDQKAVRAWIDANTDEFEGMRRMAAEKLAGSPGMFHAASDGVKRSLIYFEAWGYAAQKALVKTS
jgi:hypothetical protein